MQDINRHAGTRHAGTCHASHCHASNCHASIDPFFLIGASGFIGLYCLLDWRLPSNQETQQTLSNLPGAQHEDVVKLLDNSGASNPGWKPRAPQETMLSGAKIVRNQSIAEKYLSRHQRLAMRCIAEGRGAGPHPR